MRNRLGFVVAVTMVAVVGLAFGGSVASADPPDGIPVLPVHGQAVGDGVRMYVDVFYAGRGNPGPPGGGSGGGTNTPDCARANVDGQDGWADPFAHEKPNGLALNVNSSGQPSGVGNFAAALQEAAAHWTPVGQPTLLTVNDAGGAAAPTQDGNSTVGWAKLVPKSVLAATWTYVDASNTIIETDTFFNTSYLWTTSTACVADGKFVVQDVATHEFGHSLGLSHFSDAQAQATMYPSAPPNETRKITPTVGDFAALASNRLAP